MWCGGRHLSFDYCLHLGTFQVEAGGRCLYFHLLKFKETRYALLECSAQSRLASSKLGKISFKHFFRRDFCFDLNLREI